MSINAFKGAEVALDLMQPICLEVKSMMRFIGQKKTDTVEAAIALVDLKAG